VVEAKRRDYGMLVLCILLVINDTIVVERPVNESISESEVKSKKYYMSCMDPNKLIEKLGETPLVSLIKETFNGWTVGGDWTEDKWDFQDTLEAVHSLGLSNFFSVWVGEDEKVPTQNILQVIFFSSACFVCGPSLLFSFVFNQFGQKCENYVLSFLFELV
jgi:hypothetical protein